MTTSQDPPAPQAPPADVDVIDVLIRNLESAKAIFESTPSTDEKLASDPVFCALLYASPGQICPFYYYHSLTETEPIE